MLDPLWQNFRIRYLPHGAMGKSAVCDYGISWAYSITFSQSGTFGSATNIISLGVLWHMKIVEQKEVNCLNVKPTFFCS